VLLVLVLQRLLQAAVMLVFESDELASDGDLALDRVDAGLNLQ